MTKVPHIKSFSEIIFDAALTGAIIWSLCELLS